MSAYVDGASWAAGPQTIYDRLADRAVDGLGDVAGSHVLDCGAGTGAATRALLQRGARVTAADTSAAMLAELRRQTAGRVPTLLGDISALPITSSSYDGAIAAFVLNQLDDPVTGVSELARVTRPGGVVVATTFGADDHPIKPAVDEVLARFGFAPPDWYRRLKTQVMPLIATGPALAAVGERGGLTDVSATLVTVDFSELPAETAAGYRLGMPHVTPFRAGLDPEIDHALVDEVIAAVRRLPPLWLPMLTLRGQAPH